jgi:hypothetical protein
VGTESASTFTYSFHVTFISQGGCHLVGIEGESDLIALYAYRRQGIPEVVSRMFGYRNRHGFPVTGQTLTKSEIARIRGEISCHEESNGSFRAAKKLEKAPAHRGG